MTVVRTFDRMNFVTIPYSLKAKHFELSRTELSTPIAISLSSVNMLGTNSPISMQMGG